MAEIDKVLDTAEEIAKEVDVDVVLPDAYEGEQKESSPITDALKAEDEFYKNIADDLSDEVFMRYYGNLKITSVYSHQKWEDTKIIAKIPEDFSRYSDKINRMATKFDSSDIVYDKFGEPDRYKGNVKSLLSYRNNDKQYYLSKNKRSGFLPKSYMVKEKKILKTLKQGVE